MWLNPLLRFRDFSPRARGVRAILPHVDAMLAAHNLDSLAAVGRELAALSSRGAPRLTGDTRWN